MTAMTVERFREIFPVFASELYPDGAVAFRLDLADAFFSPALWKPDGVREHVMALYTAHYLAAFGSSAVGGSGKGAAGQATGMGIVSSKSVDGASVSYDTSSTTEEGAGFWNATPYGRELYQLMRVFGAGAIQL